MNFNLKFEFNLKFKLKFDQTWLSLNSRRRVRRRTPPRCGDSESELQLELETSDSAGPQAARAGPRSHGPARHGTVGGHGGTCHWHCTVACAWLPVVAL